MFKKKPIYIIGIVLFTLILIADLVLYFWIPGGYDRGDLGSFGGIPGGGFAPGNSDFDTLEGSDTDEGGISSFGGFDGGGFQNEGDFGNMPSDWGSGDFSMPEGMERPEGMTPPEGLEMPEGFDPFSRTGGGQMGGAMAIFAMTRSAFWPVLIVCILGDGLCIWMLIRISRKKKASALQIQAASGAQAEQSPGAKEDE